MEKSNEPYATAKIAGLQLCHSYNRQFYKKKPKFISLIPPNLFGPNDNYNQENSHVLAALLRKFFLAKNVKKSFVTIWGSGNPKREFMYSEDAGKIIVKFLEISDKTLFSFTKGEFSHFNIGCSRDYSIAKIASIIKKISFFKGRLKYNKKYPDGVARKLLNSS